MRTINKKQGTVVFHFGKDDSSADAETDRKRDSQRIKRQKREGTEDSDSCDELFPADDGVAVGEAPEFDFDAALRSLQQLDDSIDSMEVELTETQRRLPSDPRMPANAAYSRPVESSEAPPMSPANPVYPTPQPAQPAQHTQAPHAAPQQAQAPDAAPQPAPQPDRQPAPPPAQLPGQPYAELPGQNPAQLPGQPQMSGTNPGQSTGYPYQQQPGMTTTYPNPQAGYTTGTTVSAYPVATPGPYGARSTVGQPAVSTTDYRRFTCGMYVSPEPRERSMAALWCFFLGMFGAANFYMGNNLFGVIKLPLCIVSLVFLFTPFMVLSWLVLPALAIWQIVEFIMILAGSDPYRCDGNGIPLL